MTMSVAVVTFSLRALPSLHARKPSILTPDVEDPS